MIDFDQAKSEVFAKKMAAIQNNASIALLMSIGHQTGLFDTMAELAPSTSEEIASEAKLNERYVREWLGAMVTGYIVDYEPADETYFLPPERASWLTRAAGRCNMAANM